MIQAKNEGNTVVLNIHSEIGETSFWDDFGEDEKEDGAVSSVKDLQKILNQNKNAAKIDIYINSCGGDTIEGVGIYNILKRNRAYKRVFVDGVAMSAASVIAMAGNSVYMPRSSMQMIHKPWTAVMGNADEMRKAADDLDHYEEMIIEAYMTKFKGTREELKEMLKDETYLTADQCLEYGLCTKVTEDMDDTSDIANEALEKVTAMYDNKLKKLVAIKDVLATLPAETEKPETVKEAEGDSVETVKESGSVKDSGKGIEQSNPETMHEGNELTHFFMFRKEK